MEASILVLASASFPLGLIAIYDLFSHERMKGAFGIASATWSICGVVLVWYGVPGLIFFPGLLLIIIASSLLSARRGAGRAQYLKSAALSVLLVLVTIGMVML